MAEPYNRKHSHNLAAAVVKAIRDKSKSPPPAPVPLASIPESAIANISSNSLSSTNSLVPRRPLPGRNRLHNIQRTKKNSPHRNSPQRNLRPLPGSTRLRDAAHTHRQTIKHILNVDKHKAKVDRVVDIIDAYRGYLYIVKPIMANSVLNMNKQNAKKFAMGILNFKSFRIFIFSNKNGNF